MFPWCNVAAALQLVCTSDDKSDWNYIYIDTENNVGAIGNNVGKLSWSDSSYNIESVIDKKINFTMIFNINRHDGRYRQMLYHDNSKDILTINGTCEKKKKVF